MNAGAEQKRRFERIPVRVPLRISVRIMGGMLVGLVVLELLVRWLLFVPTRPLPAFVLPAVAWARRPGLWADSQSDDLYWALLQRWTPRDKRIDRAPRFVELQPRCATASKG